MPGEFIWDYNRRMARQQGAFLDLCERVNKGISKPRLCNNCQERSLRTPHDNLCEECFAGRGPATPQLMPSSVANVEVAA
jgi:hypothetical protein